MSPQTETKTSAGFKAGVKDYRLISRIFLFIVSYLEYKIYRVYRLLFFIKKI